MAYICISEDEYCVFIRATRSLFCHLIWNLHLFFYNHHHIVALVTRPQCMHTLFWSSNEQISNQLTNQWLTIPSPLPLIKLICLAGARRCGFFWSGDDDDEQRAFSSIKYLLSSYCLVCEWYSNVCVCVTDSYISSKHQIRDHRY